MIGSFEENKSNAKTNMIRSGYILPVFNEYIQYTKLINVRHLKKGGNCIKHEFEARNIVEKFNEIMKTKARQITRMIVVLKANEKVRFETELNSDLTKVGLEFTSTMKLGTKLSLLKEKIQLDETKGIHGTVEWNAYEIDRVKFFKKQSDGYNALDLLQL